MEKKYNKFACSHYLFKMHTMSDAPPGLVALVGKERYRVVKLCWCTWFNSDVQEAVGSLIVKNGQLVLAEKLSDFVEIIDELGNK
jgi:hypothetical protein